ncbi:MAG: type II toxin-antitoxin system RelE/ParE family toxin [Coleofasciculaceae cyanobacterium SM2_1_6]|nr:type II toxin-antitoxin system RelE/ParE family toxin [Coleofasciculaceae cyanobacterium SM2_1_6]
MKDLKSLKSTPIYQRIYDIAFTTLPNAQSIQEIANVKAMQGFTNRYRIRVGDYRIGLEISENTIEIIRTLHRKEFDRYFP